MVNVRREGVILRPTANPFESKMVLNPAVYQEGNKLHLIYRAVDGDYISCLGYARLEGPTNVVERWSKPFLYPKRREESKGIEDPRIVKIDDTFYMTYVAHDGKNAVSAFSSGTDIMKLRRGGVISPKIAYKDAGKIFAYSKLKDEYYFFQAFYQEYGGKNVLIWHKDCILFPERIDDKFLMMERILPDVQLVSFDDFAQLKDKYFWIIHLMNLPPAVIIEPIHGFESRHVGGGCPPIKTPEGWLVIYHAAQEFNKKRIYRAGAILLDLADPLKVIGRLPEPLMSPETDYERSGQVNDVVFPSGSAIFDGRLYLYYGAADDCIGAASMDLGELIAELKNHPTGV